MTRYSHPLAGKVALVTGGSRGIGAAIVRRLAEDGRLRRLQLRRLDGPRRRAHARRYRQWRQGDRDPRRPSRPLRGPRARRTGTRRLRTPGHPGQFGRRVRDRHGRRPGSRPSGVRPTDRRQREGRCRRGPRRRSADGRRRAHRLDRYDGCGPHPLSRGRGLRRHQGGGGCLHARLGPGLGGTATSPSTSSSPARSTPR